MTTKEYNEEVDKLFDVIKKIKSEALHLKQHNEKLLAANKLLTRKLSKCINEQGKLQREQSQSKGNNKSCT